jgi:prepilin-type N-terminal cleavage/methylation domain-containing protein
VNLTLFSSNNKSRNQLGYSLVELLVVMAVFLIVLIIASQTFNTIITYSSKYTKSEESNIEGIIGLEIVRHDLEQMGFGLFWDYLPTSSINYNESTDADSSTNDAPHAPRAFVGLDNFANYSSDFFGVKATTVGSSKASQRWSYISFHNFSTSPVWDSRPINWPSNNLVSGTNGDVVIAVRHNFNDSSDDHLLLDNSGAFQFSYKTSGIDSAFLPSKDQQVSMVYGVAPAGTTLRMPFNRADFMIKTTSVPAFCAPSTGVLYKSTVNHSNGGYTSFPLLDCVAGMQVVLGWDTSEGGSANSVSAYSSLPRKSDGAVTVTGGAASEIKSWLTDPQGIREHLKMVKVYILAQEGRKDRGFTYPSANIVVGDPNNGETSLTRIYNFSADQRQYHWKLYRIIVRPKNLQSNQQ